MAVCVVLLMFVICMAKAANSQQLQLTGGEAFINTRLHLECSLPNASAIVTWHWADKFSNETVAVIQEFEKGKCSQSQQSYLMCTCNTTVFACAINSVNVSNDGQRWRCSASIAGSTIYSNTHTISVTKKTDCLVSEWTEWSGPFGFGQMSRERKVLHYPANGGAACPPELDEVKQTTQKPTIQSTARAMATNFVTQTHLKNGRVIGQLRDLLVIVDSSGSVGASGFATAKTQLARLLGMLCPNDQVDTFDSKWQRAALLEYSTTMKEIFDFDDKPSTHLVQEGVQSMSYMGESTCTAIAFNYAYDNMYTTAKGMRTSADVKQEVLILTDGESNCGGDAIAAAKKLHGKAKVFGLMIGPQSPRGMDELKQYVSLPLNKHLFAIDGLQVLELLVNEIENQLKSVPCAPFDI